MLIVALTGGIGSGKTTVGDIFSELGAVVIDSDQLARAVLERGSKGFDLVLAKFGDAILKNGELDRSLLATLVFNDSQKRSELESITHPLIRQSFAEIISSLPRESIVINQIPLLFESKGAYKFDHIITISAPEELRIERLKNRKAISLPTFWDEAVKEAKNYSKARGLEEAPPSFVVVKRRNASIERAFVIQDLESWLGERQ